MRIPVPRSGALLSILVATAPAFADSTTSGNFGVAPGDIAAAIRAAQLAGGSDVVARAAAALAQATASGAVVKGAVGAERVTALNGAAISTTQDLATWLAQNAAAAYAVDVHTFGAVCDGVTDDSVSLNRALSSGRALKIPSFCYTGTPLLIPDSGSAPLIVGNGVLVSGIIGAPSLSPILQIGSPSTSGPKFTTLRDFRVARAGGTPPAGSIGILWASFNYGVEDGTDVQNSAILRRLAGPTGSLSIEWHGKHLFASNATQTYMQLANAAGVRLTDPDFGLNGGESYTPSSVFEVGGQFNDLTVYGGNLIPQGPASGGANGTDIVSLVGAQNPGTVIKLNGVNAENYRHVVASDAASPYLGQFGISGGRFGGQPTNDFWGTNPATAIASVALDGFELGNTFTLPPAKWVSLTGDVLGGSVTLAGTGQDLNVAGGTILGNLTLSGAWKQLHIDTPVQGACTDTSAATGYKAIMASTSCSTGIGNGANTFTGQQTAPSFAVDAQFYTALVSGTTATQNLGAGGAVQYDRVNSILRLLAGGVNVVEMLAGGTYWHNAFNMQGGGSVTGGFSSDKYLVGSTAGVSCSGVPTTSYAVTNGIVTHC